MAARGASLQRLAPLVRARLDRVDGKPVAATRDDDAEDARRLRSRRYNLTYRPALNDSERMLSGRAFSGTWNPDSGRPAEMSLEIDFAERLGIGIGDTLAFDVQGVAVKGEVVSLREVRWNSFQPNFFVVFQPGVLEEAPAVYLASIPQLPPDQRDALQASLAAAFPNVSSIDVTRAVQRLLGLIDQLQWALAGSAALSLVVGWLLVTALARDAARERRWEINLLKVLGAELRDLRRSLDVEFAVLGGLAALAGQCGERGGRGRARPLRDRGAVGAGARAARRAAARHSRVVRGVCAHRGARRAARTPARATQAAHAH